MNPAGEDLVSDRMSKIQDVEPRNWRDHLPGSTRKPNEAAVLQHGREIFERLKAAPALAETDALLQQAMALSS